MTDRSEANLCREGRALANDSQKVHLNAKLIDILHKLLDQISILLKLEKIYSYEAT